MAINCDVISDLSDYLGCQLDDDEFQWCFTDFQEEHFRSLKYLQSSDFDYKTVLLNPSKEVFLTEKLSPFSLGFKNPFLSQAAQDPLEPPVENNVELTDLTMYDHPVTFDLLSDAIYPSKIYPLLPVKDEILTYEESIMVDPNTLQPTVAPFLTLFEKWPEKLAEKLPEKIVTPYHPSHDHDYPIKFRPEVKQEPVEDEPVVDVWEIENFSDDVSSSTGIVEHAPAVKKQTRRSVRAAELKRRQQARRISTVVHAAFNKKKSANARQYKKTSKPHNSVETTPFQSDNQSDVDEWFCQRIKPTTTKITKKKTSKGRIDHSESERHRREILRKNFQSLSELIPKRFLVGEKPSAQISKQKILNGAKAYLVELRRIRKLYKRQRHKSKLFKEKLLFLRSVKIEK